jgi:anti-sigma factor RsiW
MTHLTEQDLVLRYYGELASAEEEKAARHLAGCAECRHAFTRLQRVLGMIDESIVTPEVPEGFERTVWARLEPAVRRRRGSFRWGFLSPVPMALAAAVLVLVAGAFFAGRMSSPATRGVDIAGNSSDQVRERILLVDLGEHLDRSQMVLVELVSGNEQATIDVSGDRAQAEQLLAANRLYRQTATSAGDTNVSDLLDELERVLVELAAGPRQLTPEALEGVRRQVEGKGLLFRVRVVSSEVRERQKEAMQRRTDRHS